MHAYVVPPLTRALSALSNILTKAEAHATEAKIDPDTLLLFRLYPDMLNFTRQVQLTCDFAARLPARVVGDEVPSFPDVEKTFGELQSRIARTSAHVASFAPERFVGAETREVAIKTRTSEMKMSGVDYATQYALPQLYFHLTTAYDILRHNGVVLGKRDYMGA